MLIKGRAFMGVTGVVLLLVFVLIVAKVAEDGQSEAGPGAPRRKPNILLIMTDDETLESVRVLANVDRLITKQGTNFTHYYASFPNCCPSRATLLTGQFSHNNGVRDNVPPYGSVHNLKSDQTLPVWLKAAGYYTAHIGKYLNGWGADGRIENPKGWDHWAGLIDPTTYNYYNYSVSFDGQRRDFGEAPADYQTDVLGGEVVRTIEERAAKRTTGAPDQPWYISWAPLAPHAQEGETTSGETQTKEEGIAKTFPTPAPKYKGKYAAEPLPKPPSFNQADMSKMPAFFRERTLMQPKSIELVEQEYRQELESLQSVDEWVGNIFNVLEKTAQLDNTVVLFTSDNGFYHGEHRLTFFKVFLYEEGVHLPLIVRGPGFPRGASIDAVAGNVDLAPTILKLAGATSPLVLDGRDLGAVAIDPGRGANRGMLLENLTRSGTAHSEGIHTDRYVYLTNERNEEELFDLQSDPSQIDNRADDPSMAAVKADLANRTTKAKVCKGAECEGATGKGD
jgi:N-acetylglucosamine-6-sulfatase